MRFLMIPCFILLTVTSFTGCVTNTTEGAVQVQVVRGQINRIIKPSDGWVGTLTTVGDQYFDIDLRSFTENVDVGASTKDNAALKISIAVTAHVIADDDSIKAYVRKFGLEQKERHDRRNAILMGHVNTETKNAVAGFDAYSLLANQEAIQKSITNSLSSIFKQQLLLELESVQIIGRPDFVDDRIELAASAVVANQKAKEAAEADLARAKVEAEKKQVEALTFNNPALLQIKLLEMRLDIERARAEGIAKHQGSLTIVNGANDTQIQLRAGEK
jgi:SPFH domain / Band 7 family